jgi:hypothetical protein
MNEQDVIDRLRAMVKVFGSQRAYAEAHSISEQYLSDVLRGRREPGKRILDALRIERVVSYRDKQS